MSGAAGRVHFVDAGIRVDSIPAAGRDIEVIPSEQERGEVAAQVGVSSVDALEVRLHALKFRGGIRVTGRLTARVTQPSVVTLEPLQQDLSEPIDRIFLPGAEKSYAGPADAEVFVNLEGEELPDRFEGAEADLSDLIVETLALGIDLYPKSDSETLELPPEPTSENDSPFAALRALKDKKP